MAALQLQEKGMERPFRVVAPCPAPGKPHTPARSTEVSRIIDIRDTRYITHPLHDLLTQRIFQIASGYEDGNDADTLRHDPIFKLAANKAPLDPNNLLASGATHSRFEGALSSKDIYRMARALVLQFIAGYSGAPASITLDLDHAADITHGQQELSFYNHHYNGYCYLPLLVFEASTGALVTAVLRPGKRPTGAENAMIMKRGNYSGRLA